MLMQCVATAQEPKLLRSLEPGDDELLLTFAHGQVNIGNSARQLFHREVFTLFGAEECSLPFVSVRRNASEQHNV